LRELLVGIEGLALLRHLYDGTDGLDLPAVLVWELEKEPDR
jgi:hypothetical protein